MKLEEGMQYNMILQKIMDIRQKYNDKNTFCRKF